MFVGFPPLSLLSLPSLSLPSPPLPTTVRFCPTFRVFIDFSGVGRFFFFVGVVVVECGDFFRMQKFLFGMKENKKTTTLKTNIVGVVVLVCLLLLHHNTVSRVKCSLGRIFFFL